MVIKNFAVAEGVGGDSGQPNLTERSQNQSQSRDPYADADIIRLSLFLRSNPLPILVCSPDGVVIRHNPAALKLLKHLNISESEILPLNHAQLVQDCLEAPLQQLTIERAVCDRVFAITYNPVSSFSLVYLYVVEITDYRHAEEEFLRLARNTTDTVKSAVLRLRTLQPLEFLKQTPSSREHSGCKALASDSKWFATMDGCVYRDC